MRDVDGSPHKQDAPLARAADALEGIRRLPRAVAVAAAIVLVVATLGEV